MGHWLLAVLVRGTATVDDIDAHLTKPMRPLLREQRIDGYRLGGQVTGGWDPDYDPTMDPASWRPCGTCGGSTRVGRDRCTVCAAAEQIGRTAGTVVAWHCADWAPHPGDIVALPRLLDPAWRFPAGRTPIAWVDLAGVVWLGTETAVLAGTDTGQVPPRLRQVFDDLLAGRAIPNPACARRTGGRSTRPATPWRWSMPTTEPAVGYRPPVGTSAVFAAGWLRYQPVPGHDRYLEGYVGVLAGWWNGSPEFTVDAVAAAAIAAQFDEMATYVGGDWSTVGFDGHVLTVARPLSLGGGVHRIEPVDGRYRIGWGLPWCPVDAARCDRIVAPP